MKGNKMKSLKEILNTPLEEMDTLDTEELDLYIENIINEVGVGVPYERLTPHAYKFNIGNLLYRVEIMESEIPGKKKMIEVKFKLLNNPKAPRRVDFQTNQQYQIVLQKSQIGITGTGNSQTVISTVINIFIESIKEIQPDYITFTADGESRQSLYRKLVQLMLKRIPIKYNRISVNPLTGDHIGDEEFWLEKVK